MSKTLTLNAPQTGPLNLPRQPYKFRIKEEPKFKLSRAEQPMLVFTTEVVTPTVKIDGQDRDIAGTEVILYATLQEGKTYTLQSLHKQAKLPLDLTFNDETGLPEGITYTGIEFDAIGYSEESKQLGQDKQPLINPLTGQPLVSFQHRIGTIF